MSKKGISQIKGPSEIKIGETAWYEVSRIHRLEDQPKVVNAKWELSKRENGKWRTLRPKAGSPPKVGAKVLVTITNPALVNQELLIEAYIYEAEKTAPPGLKVKILPAVEKKITRVELFMADDTPITKDTVLKYNQTIKVKVYTQAMQGEMVTLLLYEDDVTGGEHNAKNEPNKVAEATKTLDENGFLWHEFKLLPNFSAIANAMMDGSKDKLHEYYVVVKTAEHKSVSKNANVENPDYVVVQTVSGGKPPVEEKVIEIEEVVIIGKKKTEIGANPLPPSGNMPVVVDTEPEEKKEDDCVCKKYNLIWGNKVSCEFRKKVIEICAELWGESRKMNMANGLMAVINVETGGSFKAHQIMGIPLQDVDTLTKDDFWMNKTNKTGGSRAVGLIQFTQAALEHIGEFVSGTGFDKLHEVKLRFAKMGEVAQLNYVKKYFEDSKDKILSPEDIYLSVFAPIGIGKPNNYVLYDKNVDGQKYEQNKSVDEENNDDKKVQRSEILARYNISFSTGLINKSVQFLCGQEKVKNELLAKDVVQIRIYYQDALIEKHVPKNIKSGHENKYEYIYIDKNGTEHKIGEYSHTNTKLVNLARFKRYKKDNINIAIGIKAGQENKCYIKTLNFAALIGALAEIEASDLYITQFSTSDGDSPAPSVSHKEGVAGDLRYLSTHRDGRATILQDSHFDYERNVALTKALYKFGYGKDKFMLSENFIYKGKSTILPHTLHYAKGSVRHYHHLHIQGLSANYKEIKE